MQIPSKTLNDNNNIDQQVSLVLTRELAFFFKILVMKH